MVDYTFFIIGGGSGGLAAAKRAAMYGAKVALAEMAKLGGTCVNYGCVPKKYMWYCGSIHQMLSECSAYGFSFPGGIKYSWEAMKKARETAIAKLNESHLQSLKKSNITYYNCKATIMGRENDHFRLQVGNTAVTAEHVLIASGSHSIFPPIPGTQHCIDSNGFFELSYQPKKVAIIGGGYIAVELSSIFTLMGTETHLFTRGDFALRNFDTMLSSTLMEEMKAQGCIMHPGSYIKIVDKCPSTGLITVKTDSGKCEGFDEIIFAIGRAPQTDNMGLDTLKDLALHEKGHIIVDAFQNTSVTNLYAIGDVAGKVQLTPIAISAGRHLADRLFGGKVMSRADYANVPTVIFTHPCIATIGLTEAEAMKIYTNDELNIYTSSSVCLYHSIFETNKRKPAVKIKLICLKSEDDRILGLHLIGMGAEEILQGFAVAIKMGATKQDFDKCVAIHPTVAEEIVTIPGLKN